MPSSDFWYKKGDDSLQRIINILNENSNSGNDIDITPDIKLEHFQENLEDATENQYTRLLTQAEDESKAGDAWLKTLLNSYVSDTHIRLAFAETDQAQYAKVGSIIRMVVEGNTEYKGLFSKKNNNFSAFITYRENQTNSSIIEEIKIFNLTKGKTELGKDLIELVDKLLVNHSVVKWSARSDNPKAIKHYNAYVKHKFGQNEQKIPDKFGLVHYSVP
jgi:hypothetical protein